MMDFAFWPYKFNFRFFIFFFFFNSQSLLPTIMSIHCQSQTNKPFFSFFFFFHSLAFPLITHLAQNSKDYLDMWCKIRLKLKKSGMKPRLGIRGKVQTKKRENKSL